MKWHESSAQPGSCNMELTRWEAEILVCAVVDYCLDRLRDEKGPQRAYQAVLNAVTGKEYAQLSDFGPHDIPKLTDPLQGFAHNTAREAEKLLSTCNTYAEQEMIVSRRSDGIKALMLCEEMTAAQRALIESDKAGYWPGPWED